LAAKQHLESEWAEQAVFAFIDESEKSAQSG
jgi:hypothetical protein